MEGKNRLTSSSGSGGIDLKIPNLTLNQVLEQSVSRWPDNMAISFYDEKWTYSELKKHVDTFASALQQIGVQKGDRVALMLPNCPQYIVSYYGILAVGGTVVQINPMFTERELHFVISDSGAGTIIALESSFSAVRAVQIDMKVKNIIFVSLESSKNDKLNEQSYETFLKKSRGHVKPVVLDPAEDLAIIQYTGGTTGRSKGAMLTHRNLVTNILQHTTLFSGTMFPGVERVLTVIPLFHVYGMTLCMNMGIYQGSCLVLLTRFNRDEVLQTIKRERITYFPGVPTMYTALNNHPEVEMYGMNEIKVCHCGGASLPLELLNEFEQKTGTNIFEAYGLSETSPGAICQSPFDQRIHGSVGKPLPGTEIKIVDLMNSDQVAGPLEPGELFIKGPQVMKGYWNMEEETIKTLQDGWLSTGDIAKMDKEGNVYIIDRKKDLIIASGYNVYPREIEEVLYEHPAVLEAVVIGVPDSYRGETVKAFVVIKDGHKLTAEELSAHCQKNLSSYKVPKIIEFRSSLPKTSVGKLLRRALREPQK
ncbi:long-chain fatty acid--CoA ligase [Rhodococcus qingshengii]|nr:long-chain fatty acid--CoA ligase [Rhodococcus qingshengii]